jgi:hypothetical protein
MSSTDKHSHANPYRDIMEDSRGPASEKQDRSARSKFDYFLKHLGFTNGFEEVRKSKKETCDETINWRIF